MTAVKEHTSDADYPRVLIIGECFGVSRGGEITLTNLFRGWPKARIAVAARREHFVDVGVCDRYYRLGSLEDYWVWPLSSIERSGKASGPIKPETEAAYLERTQPHEAENAPKTSIIRRVFYNAIDSLGIHDLVRRMRVSHEFLQWVREFQPDVIYAQFAALSGIRFVNDFAAILQIPLVIHIMDDWLSTIYRGTVFSSYMRMRTRKEFRTLLQKSIEKLSISEAMAEEYERRYGAQFIPFHNPVDLDMLTGIARNDWEYKAPFTIMYRGRVGKSIWNSLIDVCEVVAELYAEGNNICMTINLPDVADELVRKTFERASCVTVEPPLPYLDVPKALTGADLLLIANDFDKSSIEFVKYSIPTKATEYMASGVPILIYAPAEVAVTRYALRQKWAFVNSEHNPRQVKEAILSFMEHREMREEYARRAMHIAAKNHASINVRNQFREILKRAADRGKHA